MSFKFDLRSMPLPLFNDYRPYSQFGAVPLPPMLILSGDFCSSSLVDLCLIGDKGFYDPGLEVFLGISVAQLTVLIVFSYLASLLKLFFSVLSKSLLFWSSLMARSFDSIAVINCFSIVPSAGCKSLLGLLMRFTSV